MPASSAAPLAAGRLTPDAAAAAEEKKRRVNQEGIF